MTVAVVASLLLSAAVALLVNELTAAAPQLAERVLRRAARGLPTNLRDDCLAEWLGDLDVCVGAVNKLRWAVGTALRATTRHLLPREARWTALVVTRTEFADRTVRTVRLSSASDVQILLPDVSTGALKLRVDITVVPRLRQHLLRVPLLSGIENERVLRWLVGRRSYAHALEMAEEDDA